MGVRIKLTVGLVEAYVSVSSDTENLNVNAAQSLNILLIILTALCYVLCLSVRNEGICLVDVLCPCTVEGDEVLQVHWYVG